MPPCYWHHSPDLTSPDGVRYATRDTCPADTPCACSEESNLQPSTISVLRRNLDSVTFSCWQQIVMYIKSLSLLLLYARCYLIATGALSRYRPYVSSIPKMYNSFILWEHGTWCWTRTNIVLLVREVHNLSAQPGLVPLVRIELTTLPCQSNVIPFHHRGVNLFFSSSRNRCR